MEKMEKGYFEQVAIIKGGDGQTGCGSFAGMYTRLDDPEVFGWIKYVIFGTTPEPPTPTPSSPRPTPKIIYPTPTPSSPRPPPKIIYPPNDDGPCDPNPCGFGSICKPQGPKFICACKDGYFGKPPGVQCQADPLCFLFGVNLFGCDNSDSESQPQLPKQ